MAGGGRVDDALSQDRPDQRERRGADRHHRRERELGPHRLHEGTRPREIQVLDGRLVQPRGRPERRAPPAPLLVHLRTAEPPQTPAGVCHPHVIGLDGVQHDPVIALPVDDRGQLQIVQPVLGRLERASLETCVLGSAHDPAQARALLAGACDVPDERQRDLAAERAADHRERGHAAVGEVDLADERELARRHPRLGCRDLFRDVDAGCHPLVGGERRHGRPLPDAGGRVDAAEVERPHRDPAEMQARAVAKPPGERRIERPELPEHCGVELEQPAVARGRHGRQARAALERIDLAEDVAGAQEAHVAPGFLLPGVLDQPTRLHDPPGRGALTFAHDDVAVARLELAAPADDQLDAVRGEVPERLVGAEERGDALGVGLLGERGRGLGVRAGEGDRDCAIEPQHAHRARGGAQGDRGRRVLDERALAAHLPRAEHAERDLAAVGAFGDHAHLAFDDDDERAVLGRRHGLAEGVGPLLEAGQDEVAHLGRQLGHEGQCAHHRDGRCPGTSIRLAHTSAPSRREASSPFPSTAPRVRAPRSARPRFRAAGARGRAPPRARRRRSRGR